MLSVALPNLSNPDWHLRRTALMFLGNSTEGCSVQVRENMTELLPVVLALAQVRGCFSAAARCCSCFLCV
jgi:hypothetical protein